MLPSNSTTADLGTAERQRPGMSRAAWWLWLGVFVALLIVPFAWFAPCLHRHALVRQLRARGGIVETQTFTPGLPKRLTLLLDKVGFYEVLLVDLTAVPLTDEDVDELMRQRTVRTALLNCRHMSKDKVLEFASQLPLEQLTLLDCPAWTLADFFEVARSNSRVEIMESGRAWLGVWGEPHSDGLRVIYAKRLKEWHGIGVGDLLQELDGIPVRSQDDLRTVLAGHKPGDRVRMKLRRNDVTIEDTVELERLGP